MTYPVTSSNVPLFTFRVNADDVENYRRALGVEGRGVPLGFMMRALVNEGFRAAFLGVLQGRFPVHIAQDYKVYRPISTGIDYSCSVSFQSPRDDRLLIEQTLGDPSGHTCLTLTSEIALVRS